MIKYITYKEYLHKIKEIERVQGLGIKLIYKKNMFKIVLGSSLAGLGVITLPIPTGSFILIAVGLSLMVNGGVNVYQIKSNLIRKVRVKFGVLKPRRVYR